MVSSNDQQISKFDHSFKTEMIYQQQSLNDDNMMRRLELAERSDDSDDSPVIIDQQI